MWWQLFLTKYVNWVVWPKDTDNSMILTKVLGILKVQSEIVVAVMYCRSTHRCFWKKTGEGGSLQ